MKHHITIDGETMTVLRAATVTQDSVMLGPERLERPLYEKVNKVLTTAGGKWTGKLGKGGRHVFETDPRQVLGLAIENGAMLDTKKSTQAFYTPYEVARVVLLHLGEIESKLLLEPSAGRGAIAAQCHLSGAIVDCVELDQRSVDILCSTPYRKVVQGDFLSEKPLPIYDRVAMNPPFASGQDIAHVTHAFKFLKEGGRLVSIMSPSWETAQTKKSASFRELVSNHGRIAERLDTGAFKESGTNIATIIVILDR